MNTANEPEKMPDVIWICPSGEQTYSTDEGNSTPELKYIHSSRETALLACVRDLAADIHDRAMEYGSGEMPEILSKHADLIAEAKNAN